MTSKKSWWRYRYTYLTRSRKWVNVEWVTMNAHTGCSLPKHPEALVPCGEGTEGYRLDESPSWRISCLDPGITEVGFDSNPIKQAIEATGDFLVKEISKLPGSDVINLVLCAYAPERSLVSTLIANREYIRRTAQAADYTRAAFARTNLPGAAFDLAVEHIYCSALRRADTTTTTTTTTTTVPPTPTTTTTVPPTPTTTTAVTPPSLPVVNVVPAYDTANYRLRYFYYIEAVPSSCTPWVDWQVQPSLTLVVALCPR